MNLTSDVCNAQALKILLATETTKLPLTLKWEKGSSPDEVQLSLESGVKIFSANAATCYVLESTGTETDAETLQLLEWESTKLKNSVASLISAVNLGKKAENAELTKCLQFLTKCLGGKKFLVKEKLSAADIVIWAALYPLTSNDKLSAVLLNDVAAWHKSLGSLASFKSAVEKCCPQGANTWTQSVSLLAVQFAGLSTLPTDDKSSSDFAPVTDPVLPEKGKRNVLITSALPYVNNVPHLGNIIGCVLSGDVFARFCRAKSYQTLYISGTDEYGTATETKAIAEGLTPKQICDKYHKIHHQVYKWFNINFDFFGRTSHQNQTEICQDLFLKLHKNGLTLTESMEQLLCEGCNRFLADRFVEGECPLCGYPDARGDQCDKCGKLVNATELKNPRCKLCQKCPVIKNSNHFFLDLPKIEPKLREWMAKSSLDWTSNASIIANSWMKDGLKPRCITRDLKWGIPVPLDGYRDKVFYVWFDAPLGYISMSKSYTEDWEKWWKNPKDVEYFQFMAKDNVPFHAVMFPSAQLGSGEDYTIVNHIMATEYLNYEDGKFSKSRGVGVFGTDVQETGIPADVWRFYLLYIRPENQDSSFSWVDLMTKNNSELLNNLGNFINRALMFVEKFFDSTVPKVTMNGDDEELIKNINEELKSYNENLEKTRLREGLRNILSISRHGNQYIQVNQPWVLIKGSEADKQRAGSVLGLSVNIACLIAALLRPYMPATSDIISDQMLAPAKTSFTIPDNFELVFPENHCIGKPAPLFSKIESAHIEQLKTKYGGSQSDRASANSAGVAELQAAVQAQGEKVRQLKSSSKDKSVWQPEVTKLLELKKQLTEAEKSAAAAPPTAAKPQQSPEDVASLEAAVAAQGEKLRKLKSETKDKAIIQPEVTTLLQLKDRLKAAQEKQASAPKAPEQSTGSASIADLEAAITAQGDLVRKLKSETKDKAIIQPEVTTLLQLKDRLKAAQEKEASAPKAPEQSTGSASIADLEAAITAQGDLVRKLKSETKDKTLWQPAVDKLLDLKKKLADLQGTPAAAPSQSGGKSKKKK